MYTYLDAPSTEAQQVVAQRMPTSEIMLQPSHCVTCRLSAEVIPANFVEPIRVNFRKCKWKGLLPFWARRSPSRLVNAWEWAGRPQTKCKVWTEARPIVPPTSKEPTDGQA